MDEKLECSEKSSTESSSNEIASCNQERPEDLKSRMAQNTEARKLGNTPSSMGLPKIKLEDFDKWQAEKPISTESADDGRVLREKYASGDDFVVAYDEAGEAHKFVNEPIKEMPPDFSQVPEWRQKQLDDESNLLLNKFAGAKAAGEYEHLDFQKFADLQKEIAQRQDLTETEKCLLYSKIQTTMREKPIPVENWNEKPEMVDSWSGQSDPWHAIAGIDDKYHNRLLKLSPEDASKAIFEQEDRTEGDMHSSWPAQVAWKLARAAMGINQGDINASEGQLKAMRQLKEKGTFAAYAEEWEKQFVNKNGLDPRRGQGGSGME
ncbi:MAG: hypothetical protein K2X27_05970 [Candidatus Obscuribacterales bacterium]|nr:hypothetical protein [Candidatus Obscuribacterales bacterium]